MKTIEINIRNKKAKAAADYEIICGNSDYIVKFDFDDDWKAHNVKTARFAFVKSGVHEHIDVVFEGNECEMPALSNINTVQIGVFAGDLTTTTPCLLACAKSILCDSGAPAEPPEDVYNQIIELCNETVETAESVERRADEGEFKGDTPERGVDYWTSEDIAEMQKYINNEINTNISNLYTFKKVPDGKTIDDLWGFGAYLIEDGNTILLTAEFPNGWDEVNLQDLTGYEQTMIKPNGQVLYRRKEDFPLAWSNWEDKYATSEDTRFPVKPQLDITIEEDGVTIMDITEINGRNISSFNYTEMKITIENAQLETAGSNNEVHTKINDLTGCKMIAPSTFLNSASKQYWGGYADVKNGLMLSAHTAAGAYNWRTQTTMAMDSSAIHNVEKINKITIEVAIPTKAMPIGTRFKLWFK